MAQLVAAASDRTWYEIALLARAVLDPELLERWTDPVVSPACDVLLDAIAERVPGVGLREAAIGAASTYLLRDDVAGDVRQLAWHVDQLTIEALAQVGSIELVMRELGAEPRVRASPGLQEAA